jgi:phosphosulfolactate synthase (CoM biosynthesis protein A)
MNGSSPASSISSPSKGLVPLQGIEEVSLDQKERTVRVLSRLRDLWEVSNGWICLADSNERKREEKSENTEGLGIRMETNAKMTEEEKRKSMDVVKKVMGEQNSKRANIVREIIETEETYIRGLQELVDVFP